MTAFPNTKITACVRGAVLAKHMQPKGYLWNWGVGICEVPHLGVAGLPHRLPSVSCLKI